MRKCTCSKSFPFLHDSRMFFFNIVLYVFASSAQILMSTHHSTTKSIWFLKEIYWHYSRSAGSVLAQLQGNSDDHLVDLLLKFSKPAQFWACKYSWKWWSQPIIGNCPAGNLMLSAALQISGACVKRVLKALDCVNMAIFSFQTFFNYQRRCGTLQIL